MNLDKQRKRFVFSLHFKVVLIVVFLAFSTLMVSCAGPSLISDVKNAVSGQINDTSNDEMIENIMTENDIEESDQYVSPETIIEEQVLFDQDGYYISATQYDGSENIPVIELYIENNTNLDVTFYSKCLMVNGLGMDPVFYEDVAAGDAVYEYIYLYSEILDIADIETICDIQVSFSIDELNTYEELITTDLLTINTNLSGQGEYTLDGTGQVLIDNEDISLTYKGEFYDGGDKCVVLNINNKTDLTSASYAIDCMINGKLVEGYLDTYVLPNSEALITLIFFEEDLAASDINDFESLDFSLAFYDPVTYQPIEDSDTLTILF